MVNINRFSRMELLFGSEVMNKLSHSRVAVFGVGGVGGYAVEALARSGVGALDIIDSDTVSVTNINRQILATDATVGRYKVDVAEERIRSINPDCEVRKYRTFFLPDTKDEFDFAQYDYVVDAIDTVTGKKQIILSAKEAGVSVISSMGTGNKVDATALRVADIFETSVCPLARVMRDVCRKSGIDRLKVVYSIEQPTKPTAPSEESLSQTVRRDIPGSTAFVPAVAGLIIAGEVVKDIADI